MPHTIQIISEHISTGHFTGAALVATRNQKTVLEYYAGEAAPHLPSALTVLWPLASISKLYTAAMIMCLVEQGVLTLNTPVHHLLPKFNGGGRDEVRLRHLLTHTSGLIYESPEMEARLIAQTPMRALIEEAYTAPLTFAPGTSVAYGDYNYLLAGNMSEVATGQSFTTLIEDLVIRPMGLHATFMPPPVDAFDRIAKVHPVMAENTPGAMYNSHYALTLAHPAFGTVASAVDVVRFAHHFAPNGPRIHSEATIRTMITDQTSGVTGTHETLSGLNPQTNIPWGIGWWLQTASVPFALCDLASHHAFGHLGATGCQLMIDPESNIVVVLLTNTHVRIGLDVWATRLRSIVNAAYVEASNSN
jgi:CubicO group peptidase (beta-lactamase class C family)